MESGERGWAFAKRLPRSTPDAKTIEVAIIAMIASKTMWSWRRVACPNEDANPRRARAGCSGTSNNCNCSSDIEL
jgi:hypothetical protein